MDQIERVIQEKKDQYRIVFKHHAPIIVSEYLLVRYRLLKDKVFDDDEMAVLLRDVKSDMALQQAVRYIDVKMRTAKEVAQYLANKDYDDETIDAVLHRLTEQRLIDDQQYAESYMRTKMREGKYGPRYIVQQLVQKGVRYTVAEASAEEYTEDYLYKNSQHQAGKLWQRYRNKSFREQKQKVYQALIKNGFYEPYITEALEQCAEEKDEEEEYQLVLKQGERYLRKCKNKPLWEQKQYIMRMLYQKGFTSELIQRFIEEECE